MDNRSNQQKAITRLILDSMLSSGKVPEEITITVEDYLDPCLTNQLEEILENHDDSESRYLILKVLKEFYDG